MAHTRKDTLAKTVEWWKHLRPFGKKVQARRERAMALKQIKNSIADMSIEEYNKLYDSITAEEDIRVVNWDGNPTEAELEEAKRLGVFYSGVDMGSEDGDRQAHCEGYFYNNKFFITKAEIR